MELGTNATETIMPGTWSVLDHCLQNDITMEEVGQQCEQNTTLAADPKPGGLLTVEDKSASVWLCCSRYLLGEQLFRERGSSSECIHGLVRLNKAQLNTILLYPLSAKICVVPDIHLSLNNELMLLWKIHRSMCNDFHIFFYKFASDWLTERPVRSHPGNSW